MKQIKLAIAASMLIIQLHADVQSSETKSYTPGLGDIMGMVQIRHAKLWYAGQNQNWKLATYELDELTEGFNDAAAYHPVFKGKPIADLLKTYPVPALDQIGNAIKQKNWPQFSNAFDNLTKACIKCHESTGYNFIVIKRPSIPPFTNQRFHP